ncbi:MAG: hypothetical protein ACK53Y_18685, partial [bacterium]
VVYCLPPAAVLVYCQCTSRVQSQATSAKDESQSGYFQPTNLHRCCLFHGNAILLHVIPRLRRGGRGME